MGSAPPHSVWVPDFPSTLSASYSLEWREGYGISIRTGKIDERCPPDLGILSGVQGGPPLNKTFGRVDGKEALDFGQGRQGVRTLLGAAG